MRERTAFRGIPPPSVAAIRFAGLYWSLASAEFTRKTSFFRLDATGNSAAKRHPRADEFTPRTGLRRCRGAVERRVGPAGKPRRQENQGARDRRRRVRRASSGSVSCRAGIQRGRGIESGNRLRQSGRDRRSAVGYLANVRLATAARPMRRRRSSCRHCPQIRRRRFL